METSLVIVGESNMHFLVINRASLYKIHKGIDEFKNIITPLYLTGLSGKVYRTRAESTLFLRAKELLTTLGHI